MTSDMWDSCLILGSLFNILKTEIIRLNSRSIRITKMRNWSLFFILLATGYGLSLERHKLGIVIFNQENESIQAIAKNHREIKEKEKIVNSTRLVIKTFVGGNIIIYIEIIFLFVLRIHIFMSTIFYQSIGSLINNLTYPV